MNDVGSVFFHKNFEFTDGQTAEKLFVVIGNQNGVALVAKTTSRQHDRGNTYGCQPDNRLHNFYLPQNSCFLNKCTWICLDEFYEFTDSELFGARFAGTVRHLTALSDDHMKLLQECAQLSEDITERQVSIILGSLVADKPVSNSTQS